MESTPPPPQILQFIPLILLTCLATLPSLVVSILVAPRKGFNTALACVVSLIPFINLPFIIWLASKTDTEVLEKLKLHDNQRQA